MASEAKHLKGSQDPTDGASQKPSVPAMAPFRLALREIELKQRDAAREAEIAEKIGDEWESVGQSLIAQAFRKSASILRKAINEANKLEEARKPTA